MTQLSNTLAPPPAGPQELAPSAGEGHTTALIQAGFTMAMHRPRDEERAIAALMKSCGRVGFAEMASYSFPRGGNNITGPSINMAREFVKLWGNIRYQVDIVTEDEHMRHIRAWALDLQTNTMVSSDDLFKKKHQRKTGSGTKWVDADERDLREVNNRRGAIAVRNCILALLPRDVVDDALEACKRTIANPPGKQTAASLKERIVKLAEGLAAFGVTQQQIEDHCMCSLDRIDSKAFMELIGIYNSLRDGNSSAAEHFGAAKKPEAGPTEGRIDVESLTPGAEPEPAPATEAPEVAAPAKAPPFEIPSATESATETGPDTGPAPATEAEYNATVTKKRRGRPRKESAVPALPAEPPAGTEVPPAEPEPATAASNTGEDDTPPLFGDDDTVDL